MNWRKPIIELLLKASDRRILERLDQINRLTRQSEKDVLQYQRHRLRNMLRFAAQNVPYYREVLRERGVVTVEDRVMLDKFNVIPPLTKDVIRSEGQRLYSEDYEDRGYYENTSGGSTGEPVPFIQDRYYSDWNIAGKLYFKSQAGQDIGDPELRLWGSERDLQQGREKLSIRLRDWLYNRTDVNAFRMTKDDMAEAVELLNRKKPTWIEGYVQTLYELARFADERDQTVHSPRGVLATAGVLQEPVENLLEQVFQCSVFNRYGSREVGDVACSCEVGDGLHICQWSHYVEVLDDGMKPVCDGETGRLYITLLTNHSMPLIRYEIGDLAVPAYEVTCQCGRKTALLEKIVGRRVGVFRTRDGAIVDGEYFTHLFYSVEWVRRFQVIQRDYDDIDVYIVPAKPPHDEDIRSIDNTIREIMGKNCKVEFHFVDEITPSSSGKHLYTISELS